MGRRGRGTSEEYHARAPCSGSAQATGYEVRASITDTLSAGIDVNADRSTQTWRSYAGLPAGAAYFFDVMALGSPNRCAPPSPGPIPSPPLPSPATCIASLP